MRRLLFVALATLSLALWLWPSSTVPALVEVDRLEPTRARIARLGPLRMPVQARPSPSLQVPLPVEARSWGRLVGYLDDERRGVVMLQSGDAMRVISTDDHGWFEVELKPGAWAVSVGHTFGSVDPEILHVELREGEESEVVVPLPPVLGDVGLVAALDVDGFRVMGVVRDSPADEVGLSEGDMIVTVDGHPAFELSPQELEEVLRGEVGGLVSLAVETEDGVVDVEMERVEELFPMIF